MRTHTTVTVLGETWGVNMKTAHEEPRLTGGGFCDDTVREMCIKTLTDAESAEIGTVANYASRQRINVAHELVHAFLFESGLSSNSWADNEEIVDWIAHNVTRLHNAFSEVCLALDFQEGSANKRDK